MQFPSCISIQVGLLVWLLSYYKQTTIEFVCVQVKASSFRWYCPDCFGADLSIISVFIYVEKNRTKGENPPGSETNAPNEQERECPRFWYRVVHIEHCAFYLLTLSVYFCYSLVM